MAEQKPAPSFQPDNAAPSFTADTPTQQAGPSIAQASAFSVPSSMGNLPINLPPAVADIINKIKTAITPTPRNATLMVGAALGGAIGSPGGPAGMAAGGGAGAAGADALFQMLEAYRGNQAQIDPIAISKAMIQGGFQEGSPAYVMSKLPGQLEKGAVTLTEQMVKPTGRATGRAVEGVAAEGAQGLKFAGSTEALDKQLQTNLTDAIREVDRAYSAVPKTVKLKSGPVASELRQGLAKLSIQGEQAPGMAPKASAYKELIGWFDRHPTFTVDELRQNKSLWDNLVNYNRANPDTISPSEEVYKEGADLTRNLINKVFPDTIGKANRQVNVWSTLASSLSAKLESQVGKIPTHGFKDTAGGIVGGGVGYLLGGAQGAGEGAIAGTLLSRLPQVMQTTAWKSASVVTRRAVIQALQSGNAELATRILSTGVSGAVGNRINE